MANFQLHQASAFDPIRTFSFRAILTPSSAPRAGVPTIFCASHNLFRSFAFRDGDLDKSVKKRQKAPTQRIWSPVALGAPGSDTRPPVARIPKGGYQSIPETVVDHRPPVAQKPPTASAVTLLKFYYPLSVFLTVTEEKAPVEWAGKQILGVIFIIIRVFVLIFILILFAQIPESPSGQEGEMRMMMKMTNIQYD